MSNPRKEPDMLVAHYHLADVDGVLCVACTQSDYSQPRLVTCFWPTRTRTHDFCRHFEITQEELPFWLVKRSMAGEYHITHAVHCLRGMYLELTHGGGTQPVKTETAAYPPPKTKLKTEYRSGKWWKATSRRWLPC